MEENNYLELIHKYLTNKIGLEEEQQLQLWLSEHPNNPAILEDYAKTWELSLQYKENESFDVDAGWKRLKTKAQATKTIPSKAPARIRPMTWFKRAAAVTLILAALGVLSHFLWTPSPQWVQVNTGEETQQLKLPDGTNVHLNKNSHLTYPEQFTGESRTISFSGEAFFEVERDVNHPFIIKSTDSEVKVLGTSFNLRSYPEEENTEVAVLTGKVQLAGKTDNNTMTFKVIEAMEVGTYNREDHSLHKEKTATANSTSWKTQELKFVNTSIENVVKAIAKHYQVKLDVSQANLQACTFTSSFSKDSIEDVMASFALALNVKVEKDTEGNYRISGGKACQ